VETEEITEPVEEEPKVLESKEKNNGLPYDDFERLALSSHERYGQESQEEASETASEALVEETQPEALTENEQSESEDVKVSNIDEIIPEEKRVKTNKVTYFDDDGNIVEVEEPVEEAQSEEEYRSPIDDASDAYLQMLKDSEMTDEEIAELLGIPVEKAQEVQEEVKKREVIKKVVIKKRPQAKAKAEAKLEPVVEEPKEEAKPEAKEEKEEPKAKAAPKKKIVKKVVVKRVTQQDEEKEETKSEETKEDTNPFSKDNLLGDKADEYIKLLKDSGMSDEEIEDLLGEKK
jgi:hypothetical protein